MMEKRLIVVGGGPAGFMAAGRAAELGVSTMLIEKMKRPGRKLAITGKGRCNLTNTADLEKFIPQFGKNGRFLRQAFSSFFNTELMAFFRDQGLELVTERGGRVFPAAGKALEVVKTLREWIRSCGVKVITETPVTGLITEGTCISGVKAGQCKYDCSAVVIATGGASYPATGSSGDGYRILESAGHQIVPVRPALVPLETMDGFADGLAGLHLRNIGVRLKVNGKRRRDAFGEIEFTDFGITGPVTLQLSGLVVDALENGDRVEMILDMKPALDEKKLDARLVRDFQRRAAEPLSSILRGLLPGQMVSACLEAVELDPAKSGSVITAAERRRLRGWLKGIRLTLSGYRPFSEAIITAGGLDTREINPGTMESKIISGLFAAGEVLDVQGQTGGYNLQAAFSTGHLAGVSAAALIMGKL